MSPGVRFEDRAEGAALVVGAASFSVPVATTTSVWKLLSELRRALGWLDGVLAASVDRRALEYAALSGALSVLDAHTTLYTPKEASAMKTSSAGQFGGIGATLALREGRLTIVGTIEGTPAQRAELRGGDVVAMIDGRPTEGLAMDDAVARLRGAPGTDVRVAIVRDGRSLDVSMRRELIKVPATRHERLPDGLGYVKLHQLHARAVEELDASLASLGAIDGLVLDLRSNPGGYLDQAVKVADRFLSEGDIVATSGPSLEKKDERRAMASSNDVTIPVVVLVDRATSSGAEIIAGALERHDRAVLVGLPTFGKGTVQVVHDLPDGASLRVTIAQYLAAGGRAFAEKGFTPNVTLRDASIAPKLADDAAVSVARKLLGASKSARRGPMLDAYRALPRDPAVEAVQ